MKKLFVLIFVTVVAILALNATKASANEVRMAYEKVAIVPGETTEDDMISGGIVLEKVTKKKSRIYLGDEVLATVSFRKNEQGEKVVSGIVLSKDYLGGIFYFKNAPKYDNFGEYMSKLYPQVLQLSGSRTSTESSLCGKAADWSVKFNYDLKNDKKRCESIFFMSDGWAVKVTR